MRAPRIGILNYADVRNFGDVLFPMVVARELGARRPGFEIDFITPTGAAWAGMTSHRFDRVDLEAYDALILGGGEVVHRLDDMLRHIYRLFGLECIERPTDLVFAWTRAPVPFKAWLSLGVPEAGQGARTDIEASLGSLDFAAVRGSSSFRRLAECGSSANLTVTPDLGWLFPRLLDGFLPTRPLPRGPYFVIQALDIPDPADMAIRVRNIARRTGLNVVLLPLTRCWQDHLPLKRLYEALDGNAMLIDDDTSDIEKLAILGGSICAAGQSMHGLIGSLSQCRPAGICFPEADDKFGELLRDTGMSQLRVPSWDGLDSLVETLLSTAPGLVARCRDTAVNALDRVFDQIAERIAAVRH
jgi:polysaccharide pyruvyl transferase WcaK-like protein